MVLTFGRDPMDAAAVADALADIAAGDPLYRVSRPGDVSRADPVPLVTSFDRGTKLMAGVDKDIVAPSMGVPIQKDSRLIDAVYDPVGRNIFRSTGQTSKCCVEIRHMDNVPDNLTFLDDPRPPGKRRHTHAAFGKIALATAIQHR